MLARLLHRSAKIDPKEMPAVIAAFALIFCVMCGYFAVRSVRETASTILGNDRVTSLFWYTWIASLAIVPAYGWVVARFRRAKFLPVVYSLVALALALIGFALQRDPKNTFVMEFFFVMISVLNLFMISVFWGFLLEIFDKEQTKRLFGAIAAGGSAGALLGPTLTALLAKQIGNHGVLYMGAALFVLAVVCQRILLRVWHAAPATHAVAVGHDQPVGGNPLVDGVRLLFTSPYLLGIGVFVILLASINTFLYFEQLRIVHDTFASPAQRTQVFGTIDAVVQGLTLGLQLFVTGRIASRLGVVALVTIIPIAMVFGYLALALFSTFGMLVTVIIARRVGEYAFVRPGREMLFSAVKNQDRYRVKHVIDVPVYRGGDVLSSQLQNRLGSAGWSPSTILVFGAGIAALWALNGWWLGRRRELGPVAEQPAAQVGG
ncbi:MAG: NTP/NDP exchange transporter [Steroidobacterales bacterium]